MFDDIKIIQVTMKVKDRSNELKRWWDELRETFSACGLGQIGVECPCSVHIDS